MLDRVIVADLADPEQAAAVVTLLDMYAREPVARNAPLPDHVKREVVAGLRDHPSTIVFLAYRAGVAVGLAVCLMGFSTFAAKRLINIHDLAVAPQGRRQGVARALLAAIEAHAMALDCCKITLEVMDDNSDAKALYSSEGFAQYVLSSGAQAQLLHKTLPATS